MISCVSAQRSILLAGTIAGILFAAPVFAQQQPASAPPAAAAQPLPPGSPLIGRPEGNAAAAKLAPIATPPLPTPADKLPTGLALYWETRTNKTLILETQPGRSERVRHSRKYVEGHLGSHSFFFRGPDKKLNLRAHNLMLFVLMADGVDDDTWTYHLRNGEYSKWFRDNVKDSDLADACEEVERDERMTPHASRLIIREAIAKRYTLPVDEPSGVVDD